MLIFSDGERATVDVLLKKLSQIYGVQFREYVYNKKTGRPNNFLQFLVNGTSTTILNGLETELEDGDVLAILPPVGGG